MRDSEQAMADAAAVERLVKATDLEALDQVSRFLRSLLNSKTRLTRMQRTSAIRTMCAVENRLKANLETQLARQAAREKILGES